MRPDPIAAEPESTPQFPAYPRRNNFDLLRIVLAYAVVVYHVFHLTGHDSVPGSLAGVAVGGFFVISGFLLTWSLGRQADLRAYTVKRFFRIYPLYALVMLVQAVILVAAAGDWTADIRRQTIRYLAANLVFANFIQPTIGDTLSHLRMNAINGSAWTLKVEIACYILLPFLLAFQRRLGRGLTVALALLLSAYPLALHGMASYQQAQNYIALVSFFLTGSVLFYLGPYLDRYRGHFLKVAVICTPLILVFSSAVMTLPVLSQIVVGLWVYCFAFAGRTVTIETDVSYGAYLLHFPITQLGLLYGWLGGNPWVSLIAVGTITTLLAWVSFRYLEGPMIRLGHQVAGRLRPETQAATG